MCHIQNTPFYIMIKAEIIKEFAMIQVSSHEKIGCSPYFFSPSFSFTINSLHAGTGGRCDAA